MFCLRPMLRYMRCDRSNDRSAMLNDGRNCVTKKTALIFGISGQDRAYLAHLDTSSFGIACGFSKHVVDFDHGRTGRNI